MAVGVAHRVTVITVVDHVVRTVVARQCGETAQEITVAHVVAAF